MAKREMPAFWESLIEHFGPPYYVGSWGLWAFGVIALAAYVIPTLLK